tara:strand:+ start:41 stop:814 length:774 start_codon:yes stop_codon:yes gene_type:complete
MSRIYYLMGKKRPLRKKDERKGGVGETLRTIVYAVLIALIIRTVAYEPFNIPSSSMVPTLLVGDYLFVSKYAYGYSRHSLPLSLPIFSGRILDKQPKRGDVAVFKTPRDNSTDYIKRIVGLPGDRIKMTDGRLHINGQVVPRKRIEQEIYRDRAGRPVHQFIETLSDGRSYRTLDFGPGFPYDDTPEYVVKPGHYFMMGDNRDNSTDSRVIGQVPFENLVGRAEVVFFSTDGSAQFWEVWRWPSAIRLTRFFTDLSI